MALKDTLKRGDIVGYHFCYNMSFYKFFRVVNIKGCKVSLVPLKNRTLRTIGFMQYEVEPEMHIGYFTKDIIDKRFNRYGELRIDNNELFIHKHGNTYIEDLAD